MNASVVCMPLTCDGWAKKSGVIIVSQQLSWQTKERVTRNGKIPSRAATGRTSKLVRFISRPSAHHGNFPAAEVVSLSVRHGHLDVVPSEGRKGCHYRRLQDDHLCRADTEYTQRKEQPTTQGEVRYEQPQLASHLTYDTTPFGNLVIRQDRLRNQTIALHL